MIKWLSRAAGNKSKSLLSSTIITLVVVAMLILSGPAQAVAVVISGLQTSYDQGNKIDFQVKIEINDPDKFVPITNISLNLTGPVNKIRIFDLNGTPISGDPIIKIKPVSIPQAANLGVGYGYGYDTGTGYGYNFGYGSGYGYGYGGGGGKIVFIYNVTIFTTSLPAGDYNIVATLNTDQNVAFRSPTFNFKLQQAAPGKIIKAAVEIKPETINLASKGKFTAFITLPEGLDVRDIDVGTVVCEGAHPVKSMISEKDGGTLIVKFNTQDLVNVHTGDAVKFTVTGKLRDGRMFEGSDTVKVIDSKNHEEKEECECDEHVKEHDHEDECDEHAKDHNHEDECDEHVKEHDQENNNNHGQVKNANVVNNVNITIQDNHGTININIGNDEKSSDNNENVENHGNKGNNGKGNSGKGNSGKGNNGKGKK